jgi:hypothetical protein
MRRRLHITWQIERPYIHRPFHSGSPTLRDWLTLLIAGAILTAGLSHWIIIGQRDGWRTAVGTFTSEAFKELKEYGNDDKQTGCSHSHYARFVLHRRCVPANFDAPAGK